MTTQTSRAFLLLFSGLLYSCSGEGAESGGDGSLVATGGTTSLSGVSMGGGAAGGTQGGPQSSGGAFGLSTGSGGAASGGSVGGPAASGGSAQLDGSGGIQAASGGQESGGPAGGSTGAGGQSGLVEPGAEAGLTVYYIRHGETYANTLGIGQGTLEDNEIFSDLGQQQVDDLTEYLMGLDFTPDTVLVSPTWRTQKTIEPYLVEKGLVGEVWANLNECCADDPSGAALPTELEPSRLGFDLQSDAFILPDEEENYYYFPEGYEEGLFLVMESRKMIMDRFSQSGKTIFVLGHAGAGNILIGLLTGHDMLEDMADKVYLQNTGVQHLTQEPGSAAMVLQDQNINDPER